jgi:hypothetical protein
MTSKLPSAAELIMTAIVCVASNESNKVHLKYLIL